MDLWSEFRHHFDTDDGSLPGIDIEGLSGAQVGATYRFLRSIGDSVADCVPPAQFWHRTKNAAVAVDAVPNLPELVVTGEAESPHFCLTFHFEGISIPPIGLAVFRDAIGLDFRMGPEWTPDCVRAFLRLLQALRALSPQSRFSFTSEFGDPAGFLASWERFVKLYPQPVQCTGEQARS